jgi:hypothetical protein
MAANYTVAEAFVVLAASDIVHCRRHAEKYWQRIVQKILSAVEMCIFISLIAI